MQIAYWYNSHWWVAHSVVVVATVVGLCQSRLEVDMRHNAGRRGAVAGEVVGPDRDNHMGIQT